MRRIRMTVQYDGAAFSGWQSQLNALSVQDTLEQAFFKMLGMKVRLFASGRTDSGVHAAAMPVHFDLEHPIPAEKIAIAIAKFLPSSISILESKEAPSSFDARHQALLRWYRYQVLMGPVLRPLGPRAWRVHKPLNLDAITSGLAMLHGRHDFSGFRSSHCQAKRTLLDMQQATMIHQDDLLVFDFKCRSFLHHMVRLMVGTLISMGMELIDETRMRRILEQGQRPQLIYCAPGNGLCMMGVAYCASERLKLLEACPHPPSF